MRRCLPIALSLAAVTAHADGACKPIVEAMTRYLSAPSHMSTTTTLGDKMPSESAEMINTGSQRFIRIHGKWITSPLSAADELQQVKESADQSACKVLREEAVNGEPATVYEVKNEQAGNGEYYISKRSGLPLKEELTIDGRMHLSARVEYGPQQAPGLGQ